MPHPYHIVHGEDGRLTLTVFVDGVPLVVHGDHPNYEELIEAAQDGAEVEELRDLADIGRAVARKFDRLTERVSVNGGSVFFDGDEIDNALTRHIVRCLDDPEVGDWQPLVLFMERVAQNPQPHSREQLYEWLSRRDFTITRDGCFIAYKGVREDNTSVRRGPAVVNGEAVDGHVPNTPGAVVEIARSRVAFDPAVGCASGLHVGDYEYAHGWAQGALLRVLVDPRDVVSVPTDCNAAKMRVCRYRVVEVIDAPDTRAVAYDTSWDEDEDDDLCEFGCECLDDCDGECW